jgi:recombination protein RecA
MYDEGISKEGDVLDLGVELGLIEKRGAFYLYKDERLAQGRENTKQVLRERPTLRLEIENAIRRGAGLSKAEGTPTFEFADVLGPAEIEPPEAEEETQFERMDEEATSLSEDD